MNARADCELGKLIDDYLSTWVDDETGAERFLPEIMHLLPTDYAPPDFRGLMNALLEFAGFYNPDPDGSVNHCDMGFWFRASLQPVPYRFVVPIGWSSDRIAVSVGGRTARALISEEARDSESRLCELLGTIEAGHWSSARRKCSTVAEEFLGALMAVGVIHPHAWNPHYSPNSAREQRSSSHLENFREGMISLSPTRSRGRRRSTSIERTSVCLVNCRNSKRVRRSATCLTLEYSSLVGRSARRESKPGA